MSCLLPWCLPSISTIAARVIRDRVLGVSASLLRLYGTSFRPTLWTEDILVVNSAHEDSRLICFCAPTRWRRLCENLLQQRRHLIPPLRRLCNVWRVSVCISLFLCLLATLCKKHWTDLRENFATDIARDNELIDFWRSSASGSGFRNFLNDSSTLRDTERNRRFSIYFRS